MGFTSVDISALHEHQSPWSTQGSKWGLLVRGLPVAKWRSVQQFCISNKRFPLNAEADDSVTPCSESDKTGSQSGPCACVCVCVCVCVSCGDRKWRALVSRMKTVSSSYSEQEPAVLTHSLRVYGRWYREIGLEKPDSSLGQGQKLVPR
jgi:hypothetical protein